MFQLSVMKVLPRGPKCNSLDFGKKDIAMFACKYSEVHAEFRGR